MTPDPVIVRKHEEQYRRLQEKEHRRYWRAIVLRPWLAARLRVFVDAFLISAAVGAVAWGVLQCLA